MQDIGLRIDVDTFRGTRDGVPRIVKLLGKHDIKATFFFSVGPDNMGRNLWRLLKPKFLKKMLRSRAASLYGWDILLAGTAWPGRRIGKHLSDIIRNVDSEGHEVGLHAWDHYAWQAHADTRSDSRLASEFHLGIESLQEILRRPVDCSAVPGWRATNRVIEITNSWGLRYNSDCRGTSIFRPILDNASFGTPQIPVTLPTYDEVIGKNANNDTYNNYILSLIKPEALNVYTIHAEVEGISFSESFENLLLEISHRPFRFCKLGDLLPQNEHIPSGRIGRIEIPGREGWIACQK
jgi:undecaprenyl phosphate-alpha-L-ara4FN deformylase